MVGVGPRINVGMNTWVRHSNPTQIAGHTVCRVNDGYCLCTIKSIMIDVHPGFGRLGTAWESHGRGCDDQQRRIRAANHDLSFRKGSPR